MSFIVITPWHEENPNDWVGVQQGTTPYILIDRDPSLVALHTRLDGRKDVVYGRAWGMGIGKEYPMEGNDG